jgi:ankyrin repeat protein
MRTNVLFKAAVSIVIAAALVNGCGSLTKYSLNGDAAGVKKRLAKGDDANKIDRWGWSPALWAAYYNHYEVLKTLLEHGADPNIKTVKVYSSIAKGSTPLIVAAYYNWGGSVRLLLKHGADKNIANSAGETAANVAERFNFADILDLLEKGVSGRKRPETIKDMQEDTPDQIIYMTDGSKIVGKIISQTRETVTVQTRYTTITVQKEKISEMKYK